MTIHYDGHGARLMDPIHLPYAQYWPGTQESPEEVSVTCSCGSWSYESQASAGGGCDTAWDAAWEQHLEAADDSGPDCGESGEEA